MTTINELLNLKHTLRFNSNGEFKVMYLSDLHTKPAKKRMATVRANIKALVDNEKPDLIILNGDTAQMCQTTDQLKDLLSCIVDYFEEKKIPWAHAYGNHDDELYSHMTTAVSKEEQQKVYESFAYCVSKDEKSLYGVGTCLLPVLGSSSDDVAFNIWCIDSNTYLTKEEMEHYGVSYICDFIHQDQIDWYTETSSYLESYYGKKIYGVMNFHVPLPEHNAAWEERENYSYTGIRNEKVCHSQVNSGIFSAVLQQGDVKAIICGHDHTNDFAVNYKGVLLCYSGMASVENSYIEERLGTRVVVVKESEPSHITTYMSYINSPELIESIRSE